MLLKEWRNNMAEFKEGFSYVYILLSKDGEKLKIGKADNTKNRLKTLKKTMDFDLANSKQIKCVRGTALKIEKILHSMFYEYRLSLNEKFDGSTEYFDIDVLQELEKFIVFNLISFKKDALSYEKFSLNNEIKEPEPIIIRKSRAAIKLTEYITLMDNIKRSEFRESKKRNLILGYTLLFHTGIKIGDLRFLTYNNIYELISNRQTSIGDNIIYATPSLIDELIIHKDLFLDRGDYIFISERGSKRTVLELNSLIRLLNGELKRIIGSEYSSNSFGDGLLLELVEKDTPVYIIKEIFNIQQSSVMHRINNLIENGDAIIKSKNINHYIDAMERYIE